MKHFKAWKKSQTPNYQLQSHAPCVSGTHFTQRSSEQSFRFPVRDFSHSLS